MKCLRVLFIFTLAAAAAAIFTFAQDAPPAASGEPKQPTNPIELVNQGRKATNDGKLDDAIALFRKAEQAAPELAQAYRGEGIALDLEAKYDEARRELAKAIELSPPELKDAALRTMAISYAFTRQGDEAAKYAQQAFDAQIAKPDYYNAGEVADELARIYLESGDLNNALKWYRTGYDTGIKEPNLAAARKDLWDFRWENAQARVAARRRQRSEAQQHVAAAKAIIDKGTNPDQARFVPYLTGYVAFYLADYKDAIADLGKADQRDPFILLLEAQAHEKLNDGQATDVYRKIMTFNTHNPPNAFARPIAAKKVGGSAS
jgi:tetratricopeptide (TPR) repeat protein